jgi:hypothetical protein
MPQIQIDEKIFEAAQRRAADAGYSSVDEYVADVVAHHLVEDGNDETPNLDHLFTPERLAEIDQAAAEVEAGNYVTADQVREHLRQKREAWIQKNGAR